MRASFALEKGRDAVQKYVLQRQATFRFGIQTAHVHERV